MRILKVLTLAGIAVFAAVGCVSEQATVAAAPDTAPVDRPSFSARQTDTVVAIVASIDYETREVDLVDDNGNVVSFIAGDNVRNLNQVSVGDVLVAEHVETVSVEVFPGDGLGPDQAELFAAARTEEGEMPGGMAIDSVVITSVVKAINLDDNTFILEGPDGKLEEYVAMNPENLKRAEVGDIVVMTITESLAISVEKSE